MSALMKKHPTDNMARVLWHGGLYVVPINVMSVIRLSRIIAALPLTRYLASLSKNLVSQVHY